MKTIIVYLVILIIGIISSCSAMTEVVVINDPVLLEMAMGARTAILKRDNTYLMKFVSPKGINFIDNSYSREQLINLLNDKNSSIYKSLYTENSSARSFFENTPDVQVKIYKRGVDAVMILYQSKDVTKHKTLENCYIKVNDRWYFDGIFSCE